MVQTMIEGLLLKYMDPDPPAIQLDRVGRCRGSGCVTLGVGYSDGEMEWTRHVLEYVKRTQSLEDTEVKTVASDSYFDMLAYLHTHPNKTQAVVFFCTGVIELPTSDLPPELQPFSNITCSKDSSHLYIYAIVYNFTAATMPFMIKPDEPSPVDRSILPLKLAIDNGILDYRLKKSGLPPIEIAAEMSDFPHSSNRFIEGYDTVTMQGPLYFFLPPMIIFIMVMTEMVREKEQGLRQVLNTLGASPVSFWLSWIITSLVFSATISTLTTFAGREIGFDFFAKSQFLCVWLIFFMFTNAMVTFGYFLVTLMSSGKTTYTVTYSLLLAGLVLQGFISSHLLIICLYVTDLTPWFYIIRVVLGFYPPFNFATAFYEVSRRSSSHPLYAERRWAPGESYEWKHFFERQDGWLQGHHYITPSLYDSLQNMGINIIVFGLLTWICDHIVASNRGVSEPIYFPFTRKYWGFRTHPKPTQYIEMSSIGSREQDEGIEEVATVPQGEGIWISGLSKTYAKYPFNIKSKDDVTALKDLTLSAQKNEVLTLLGHNGAGKSTLLSILSGTLSPSSGSAYICGQDISLSMDSIRHRMGFCPQHSILWDELTAEEHVYLFTRLKGYSRSAAAQQSQETLREVELASVAKAQVGTFSGGMRRRMCIALSGVGNPDIILMDEPTTGLDPISRAQVWKLIQRIKQGKVVVLTTHSMEEADALSDKIAILAAGSLKCQGSSLALKNTYGTGYRVSIVTAKPEAVKMVLQREFSAATVMDQSADSLLIALPRGDMETMQRLFKELESGELGDMVSDWGVSNTTLEDVFMAVTGQIEALE